MMKKILEYYDTKDDKYEKYSKQTTRKPILTLAHLNVLRKRRALKDYEEEMRRSRLGQIYGSQEGGGGMMF